jgi:hypothetical protein
MRATRRVVAVDEEPASVGNAVGLRQLGVMGVVPGHEAVTRLQHRLRFLVVAPAVLRVLREDGNELEHAAGGQAIDAHLAVEAAGQERVELVMLSWRDVDAGGRVAGGEAGLRRFAGIGQCDRTDASGEDEPANDGEAVS